MIEEEIQKLLYEEYVNKEVVKRRFLIFALIGLSPIWAVFVLSFFNKDLDFFIGTLLTLIVIVLVIAYQLKDLNKLKVIFTSSAFLVSKGHKVGKAILLQPGEKLFVKVKGNKIHFKSRDDKHVMYKGALSPDFISRIQSIPYVEIEDT